LATFAHSRNSAGGRHDLVAHLRGVATLAAGFAESFGAAEAAYFLGLWHDLGKFDPAWQRYLHDAEAGKMRRGQGPDHKAAGAYLAQQHLGPLALLIQGHHGGLRTVQDLKVWLQDHLAGTVVTGVLDEAKREISDLEPPARPSLPAHVQRGRLAQETFLRLLFSALVDADYLDTERHLDPSAFAQRGEGVPLAVLWERFQENQAQFAGEPDTPVNRVRRAIAEQCLAAACQPPGIFRLAVPTGGGKTLSGMGFALAHALCHGHRRVIVAVPFISITEQTADVYRRVFGRAEDRHPAVLEHHSGVIDEPTGGTSGSGYDATLTWRRLAAENWDAPIVVTTTVRLFESLFAASTSATRKLHRLARSVIILDEAQSLPTHLLGPILHLLRTLAESYGTTVVISTATQPAFDAIALFRETGTRDIIPQPRRYFEALRRVQYEWLVEPPLSWETLAGHMHRAPQVLAIVNTKRDAHALLDALDDPGALHLSTLLCGAHRRQVIEEVHRQLRSGKPCRLVTTQVIEAGVDIDFPVVFRALGPLDSVIQAAGRCNREGRLPERGRVVVFQPEAGGLPRGGTYRLATGITATLLGAGDLDPDSPDQARRYFELLFDRVGPGGTDLHHIQELRERLDFPEVAQRFRMIDEATETVVITSYGGDGEQARTRRLVDQLRNGHGSAREIMRALQPYLVSVYRHESQRYQREGLIHPILPGVGEWLGRYDAVRGLQAEAATLDSLVV
jgi:CRISPR-associated endonuclease/helicase Cas3